MRALATVAVALAAAAGAHAQVVINEVFENPQDGNDSRWEFIELYGRPGMSLDGYAIGLAKGGLDGNGDDIPDGTGGDNIPEIDEAYSLDGHTLGANGFFVLYNDNDSNSRIDDLLPPEANSATFEDAHIPSTDTAGNLNGTGSSSYLLVRLREFPAVFRKETLHDSDFDGKLDFGTETGPFFGGATPMPVQPLQRVDEVAWSNGGGKEYVFDSQDEVSDTPGYNPDAISRVAYYIGGNPMRGHRTRAIMDPPFFEIVPTRTADESWVHGQVPVGSLSGATPSLAYDASVDGDGNRQTKAPTDQTATPYDGTCDPEPNDPGPDPGCTPNGAGSFLFTDLPVAGFALTPGTFNDAGSITQFRFEVASGAKSAAPGETLLDGDLDGSGLVDCADLDLIRDRVGATLDDTFGAFDPQGQPYLEYTWQNESFQQMLMMLSMDDDDGMGGQNSAAVTLDDVEALRALVVFTPGPCVGDANGDNMTNVFDFNAVTGSFGSETDCGRDGDVNGDGVVNVFDFNLVTGDFGCDES